MLSVYAYDSFTHQMPVYFFSALYASQKLTPATHRQQLWNCCCDWLRLCVARSCCCCCRKLITSGLLRSDCKTNTLENKIFHYKAAVQDNQHYSAFTNKICVITVL